MFGLEGTCIVAGGMGKIGSATVKLLKELNCATVIADTRNGVDVTNESVLLDLLNNHNPNYWVDCTYPPNPEDHLKNFLDTIPLVAEYMWERNGAIVVCSSIYGMIKPKEWFYTNTGVHRPDSMYVHSKFKIIEYVKEMAKALKPNMRINCVSPGGILDGQDVRFQWRYNLYAPMVSAKSVAQGIVFLLGCEDVTGHNLPVDGGFTL